MGEAGFPLSVLVIGNYSGSADVDLSNLKRHLVFEVTTRPSVSHTITFPSHKVQYGDLVDAKMGEKEKRKKNLTGVISTHQNIVEAWDQ